MHADPFRRSLHLCGLTATFSDTFQLLRYGVLSTQSTTIQQDTVIRADCRTPCVTSARLGALSPHDRDYWRPKTATVAGSNYTGRGRRTDVGFVRGRHAAAHRVMALVLISCRHR